MERLVALVTKEVKAELERAGSRPAADPAMPASGPIAPCSSCEARAACQPREVLGAINLGAPRIGTSGPIEAAPCQHVAPLIDHTLLAPEATKDEIRALCDEARRHGFATVCVNSAHVRFAAACLEGSPTVPIAVVGFPLGASASGAKAFEAREAIRAGAREIDMVVDIGALKARDHAHVLADIRAVVDASGRTPVKVIIETSKLEHDEKVMACTLAKAAGAAFVKTSTGFGGGGATAEDVALMRSVVGADMGVKASGGVRTIDDAERMIEAGANRLGASASVAIVRCERPAAGRKRAAY
jgi:deoxyribose-phosphate aldolase